MDAGAYRLRIAAFALVALIVGIALSAVAGAAPQKFPAGTVLASVPNQSDLPAAELARSHGIATNEIALVLYCMLALADHRFGVVRQACGRAILLDSTDPAPHKLRGASYLFERRFEEARFDFQEATRLDPADSDNHAGLAEALRGQGDYSRSVAEFSVAIRLAPDDVRLWNARCWTRAIFGRELNKGLADCNRALKLSPRSADILDSRGLAYLQLGDLRKSLSDYNASLHLDPRLATAWYGRGAVHLRIGDRAQARIDFAQARHIDPEVDEIFVWSAILDRCPRSGLSPGRKCTKRAPHRPDNYDVPKKTAGVGSLSVY